MVKPVLFDQTYREWMGKENVVLFSRKSGTKIAVLDLMLVCNVLVLFMSLWSWYSAYGLGLDLERRILITSGVFLVLCILDFVVFRNSQPLGYFCCSSGDYMCIEQIFPRSKYVNLWLIYFLFLRLKQWESNSKPFLQRLGQNIHQIGHDIHNSDLTIRQR